MLQASRVQGPGSQNPPWSNGGDLCAPVNVVSRGFVVCFSHYCQTKDTLPREGSIGN